jgi:hypothetical protein
LPIAILPGSAGGCASTAGAGIPDEIVAGVVGFSGMGRLADMAGLHPVAVVTRLTAISNSTADFADIHIMFIIYTAEL